MVILIIIIYFEYISVSLPLSFSFSLSVSLFLSLSLAPRQGRDESTSAAWFNDSGSDLVVVVCSTPHFAQLLIPHQSAAPVGDDVLGVR